MKVTPLLDQYDSEKIANLLKQVPLFDWILQTHPEQFPKLLPYCRLFRMSPGEIIIKKGEINQWIYIIIKGGCFAFVDESDQTPVNQLVPFDIFGEIAAILKQERSASIVANYDESETLLLGMDFSVFSEPENELDIAVKLLKYQSIQRTIFKRLRSVHRALVTHQTLVEDPPNILHPPRYISVKEQLIQCVENCKEGAKALKKYSEQLAVVLN